MGSFEGRLAAVEGYLKSIGVFVGTYGLAVFLVVYYTIELYPEVRDERAQWIQEITEVKRLVDPETRPLNSLQAKAVLDLAMNAFLGDVEQGLNYFRYGNAGNIVSSINVGGIENVRIGDQDFESSGNADDGGFAALVQRLDSLLDLKAEEAALSRCTSQELARLRLRPTSM